MEIKIKIFDSKNIFKSLISAIILSVVPSIIYKDIKLLITNFLIVFIIVMFGCWLGDLLYEVKKCSKEKHNKK